MNEPRLGNALIRCVRSDRAAKPWFESVRPDLGLWVRELGDPFAERWSEQVEILEKELADLRHELASLRVGSDDFTLFLGIESFMPIKIPRSLMELALECGFEIEVHLENP
jgi:hypothetical protein